MNPILPLLIAGAAVIAFSKKKAVKKSSATGGGDSAPVDLTTGTHLIVFESKSCKDCKRLKDAFDAQTAEYKASGGTSKSSIIYVDIDEKSELAEIFDLTKVPTVIYVVDGVALSKFDDIDKLMEMANLRQDGNTNGDPLITRIMNR